MSHTKTFNDNQSYLILPSDGDIENVSDGYHTFNELYNHRHKLFIGLMHANPNRAWWSYFHHDGTQLAGYLIAGITTPSGKNVTYHIPLDYDKHLPDRWLLSTGKEWDGHTSSDVLERLEELYTGE